VNEGEEVNLRQRRAISNGLPFYANPAGRCYGGSTLWGSGLLWPALFSVRIRGTIIWTSLHEDLRSRDAFVVEYDVSRSW
jgi:hypothetical protein